VPVGHWTHSAEEDHDGISVYRRDDYAFPPARGRRGVEFRADGTFVPLMIGRGDAPQAWPIAGRWTPDGRLAAAPAPDSPFQGSPLEAGPGRIVSATPDRLEIAWG
jgi:hypothetical protein